MRISSWSSFTHSAPSAFQSIGPELGGRVWEPAQPERMRNTISPILILAAFAGLDLMIGPVGSPVSDFGRGNAVIAGFVDRDAIDVLGQNPPLGFLFAEV